MMVSQQQKEKWGLTLMLIERKKCNALLKTVFITSPSN